MRKTVYENKYVNSPQRNLYFSTSDNNLCRIYFRFIEVTDFMRYVSNTQAVVDLVSMNFISIVNLERRKRSKMFIMLASNKLNATY